MRGFIVATSFILTTAVALAETPQERLQKSSEVFSEIMATPDKGIPQDLLNKAACVVIMPGLKKAAFVVGGEYGHGFAVCRKQDGAGWGAPAAERIEGGSVGFQIGGSETDVVMLVMNRQGMDRLTTDKFTLGADASVAAGPVGRTAAAETDVAMNAEILAWSRTKGLFAGISLNGATMRPDASDTEKLYGRHLTNHEILMGNVAAPAEAHPLLAELDRYSAMKPTGGAERTEH